MRDHPKYRLQRETVHPYISVSFSFLATSTFAYAFGDAFMLLRPPLLLPILLLLVCLEETIVGNTLQEEHAGSFARFRELLIVLLVSYVILGAIRGGNLLARYYPTIRAVVPVFFVAVAWLSSATIHSHLRSREYFLHATLTARSESLHKSMRDLTAYSVGTLRDLKRVRRNASTYLAVLLVLILLTWAAGSEVRGVTVVFIIATGVNFLVLLTLLSVFSDEFIYLGDGLRLRREDFRRRLILGALLVGAATVFTLIAASSRSLLSLDIFREFFDWFASLFPPSEMSEGSPFSITPQQLQQIEALRELEEMMQDQEPSRLWLALVRTIRLLIISAALVGLAVLVIGPFLTDTFAERARDAKPLQALKNRWKQLSWALRRLWRGFRRWMRSANLQAVVRIRRRRSAPESALSDLSAARTGRKRRQVSRIAELFLKLISWSTERGYPYRKSFVPNEYGERLSAAFPELSEEIHTVIRLFEEGIYSDHVISIRDIREYRRAIGAILERKGSPLGEDKPGYPTDPAQT